MEIPLITERSTISILIKEVAQPIKVYSKRMKEHIGIQALIQQSTILIME